MKTTQEAVVSLSKMDTDNQRLALGAVNDDYDLKEIVERIEQTERKKQRNAEIERIRGLEIGNQAILPDEQQNDINNFVNQVFNVDIMDLLKILPDKSIHMAIVDPDYNVGIKYNGTSYKMEFGAYVKWYVDLAKELYRVLKNDGNIFFIN
ncbi:MAG: hypothetical protein HQK92_14285 [Nitrospirae bacterium]|nr:hypothetical protein [Nitrospirota bacterium]